MRHLTTLLSMLFICPAAGAWQPPPPPPDDAIYFVLVDRFANGDPANDSAVDPADPQAWHGGDIRGVIEHLDEIEELGVKTVWLSPVWDCRDDKFFEWGAFHGYWIEDHGKVDPRFGTEADLRELSDALHARGMRLILDVVFNHVAMDSPLIEQKPHWFHPVCDIEDWEDPVQVTDCRVHGLPDLNQENADLYQHLLATSLRWIDAVQPDGFRIDAVRHMRPGFLRRLATDLHAHSGPDFQLLGEDFQGDALGLARSFRATGVSSMFDFPLHYAMQDVYCAGRPVGRLAATLSADREYDDPGALVPFLDNHDRPRLASACPDRDSVRQALTFLLTSRGIPSITYGTESGLEGAEEPANRADMSFEPRHPYRMLIPRLLELRRGHAALHSGATRVLVLEGDLLVIGRIHPDEAALIAVNRGELPARWTVPDELYDDASMIDGNTALPWNIPVLTIPPGATEIYLLTPEEAGAYAELTAAAGGARAIRVVVPASPDLPAGSLRLAGGGPGLGNWDPAQAVGPLATTDESHVLEFSAPVGDVLEFKLVAIGDDGAVEWQPGENHYLLVESGDEPVTVPLSW
ncbi:MAG: alpha-amylase family glycosyl hydrolase [Myxococcota bacterium]|nr:alpha-amylase family glycosyl hydrolase [Myxococcota bacterium]